MLTDYHVHLRQDGPEHTADEAFTAANAERYQEVAAERGVEVLGVSEHIHRFRQALDVPDHVLAAATDDASLVEAVGGAVRVVEAPPENLKVTTQLDLEVAEQLLRRAGAGS